MAIPGKSKSKEAIGAPPPGLGGGSAAGGNVDHSFTLQAIMEMHKSVGTLEASVNNLATQIVLQGKSMDDLKAKVGTIEKIMYAAGVILIISLAIGGWMLNTAKDFAMTYYKASLETQVKAVPETPSVNVTPPAKKK